jgi:predicted house-cleaning noncanonical NTP pyrophosphatase (MazG superfamily)
MHKLVRDLIPEVIPKDKLDQYRFSIVDDEAYRKLLHKKLAEEVEEFLEDESIEELADVLEVLDAFIALKNFSKEEIAEVKKHKKKSRGGFFNKILMETVQK